MGTPAQGPTARPSRVASYRSRRRAKKAARSRTRRRLTRAGLGLALLVVILIGGGAGYVYYQLNRIGHVKVHGLTPTATGGENAGSDDILLVGSTDRCAVQPQNHFQNFVKQCEAGVNGVNSDVVMVLRLTPGRTPVLLSIPRDTFVPNARQGDLYNRIDAALADGPSQLVAAIQQDFGIPINHYVVLNFQSFANIVTALGGISLYFPTTLRDFQSGLYISHSGCVHISGLEALALVRARHLYYHYDKKTGRWLGYDGSGDIGRIERVHIFLKVLASEVQARGLGNPITDSKLLSALAPDLVVDSTLSTTDMVHLLLDYHSKVGSAPELTLPIIEDTQLYTYKGYNYGDVVFPAEPQDLAVIDQFLHTTTPKPKPSSFSVTVVDGDGSPSQASALASSLTAIGYDATAAGSQASVGPISETTVAYRPGFLDQAEEVLSSLSGTAVLGQVSTDTGADVSVITGSDVQVTAPAAENAAAVTQGVANPGEGALATLLDAVLAVDAGASSVLAPPTPAETTKIPPYDPRACPTKKAS